MFQCLDTIRSERELPRRLKTALLFRCFLDLQPSADGFDHSLFTHNRDRLSERGETRSAGPAPVFRRILVATKEPKLVPHPIF